MDELANATKAAADEARRLREEQARSGAPTAHSGRFIGHSGLYSLLSGELVLNRAQTRAYRSREPKYLPVPSIKHSNETTVNIPVFLDGKKVAYSTTRVTGQRSSAYRRSGGRY
jgi:hypothetical protein